MRNEDILNEVDRRFQDQRELLDAKFTHLSAVIQDGFYAASQQRTEIIEHQKTTNGRVTKLESEKQICERFRDVFKYKMIGAILIAIIVTVVIREFGIFEAIGLLK